MSDYLLLAVSLMCGTGKNILSKAGNFKNLNDIMNISIVTSVLALAVFGVSGINLSEISAVSWLLAILYGLFTLLSSVLYIKAVEKGNVSVCSLIYSCGFLIPTLFSVFYFREKPTVCYIIGILLITASIKPVTKKSADSGKHNLLLAVGAMLASGCIGILQRLQGSISNGSGLNSFLFAAFLFMLLTAVFMKLLLQKGRHTESTGIRSKNFTATILLTLCTVIANRLNLYLSGAIHGVVFFPVINGGCIGLSAVAARMLFKEKLTRTQIFGIVLCTLGIAIMFIP